MNKVIAELTRMLWGIAGTGPASAEATVLAALSTPAPAGEVIQYFQHLPERDAVVHGVRFMDEASVMLENTELIPGCYVSLLGFAAFAALESGDVFAMEVSTGAVYLLAHEKYESGDSISAGWNETCTDFLPDLPMTADNVKATASAAFESLEFFLATSLSDHRPH